MKFKKIIPLLLICLLFILTACSSAQAEVEATNTTANTVEVATTQEETLTKELESTTKSTIAPNSTTATSTTKNVISNKTTTKNSATTNTTSSVQATNATTQASTVTTSKPATSTTTNRTTTTTTVQATTKATTQTTNAKPYCILTIECKEILSNMDDLKVGHESYVPSSGYILNSYKVSYSNGDTAYDILKRGCDEKGIKLTATTTAYGTYVSGINNLDEFDCGNQSGWLYSVNSAFPRVSCSKQRVNPNDTIVFKYTCQY